MTINLCKTLCGLVLSLLLLAPTAHAEEALPDRVKRLEHELRLRDGIIRNLLERVNALEDKQSKPAVESETAPPTPAMQQPPETEQPLPAMAPVMPPADNRLAQLRASAAFERRLIQRGGLLLPPYTWELEPSMSYSHSSSDHVVIDGFTVAQVLVVGDIFNERVDRDIYQAALTTRLGLPGDSQVELRVPYARVHEKVYNAQSEESSSSTTALGDIELAYSHQFRRGSDSEASILGSLRWKMATGDDPFKVDQHTASFGSGYHSLQASSTAIMTSDPVVFFGSLSYTANLPVNESAGRIDPGDSYGFQAGVALSLNMDTSLSIGWEQRFTQNTEVDGQEIPGSYLNSGSLAFGVSHTTFSGRTYDISTNIGLTRDSPDAQITLAVPFRP